MDPLVRFLEPSPMEEAMSEAQLADVLKRGEGAAFLLFPEDRLYPIRRSDLLPVRWAEGPKAEFPGQARPDEFYAFQIGVYAAQNSLEKLSVRFSDWKTADGKSIDASAMRCFSLGGVDWAGRDFEKTVNVAKGEVQALWIGVAVPRDALGKYEGVVAVGTKDTEAREVRVAIDVAGEPIEEHGDNDLWRHSRLRWLDSKIALDDEPTGNFPPVQASATEARCLGRRVAFGPTGLPERIESYFTPELTSVGSEPRQVLAAPMALVVERPGSGVVEWTGGKPHLRRAAPGAVEWNAESAGGGLTLKCEMRMEFDGHMAYRLTLSAERDTPLRDVRLVIPYAADVAKYLMGLGHEGGTRPESLDWKWDRERSQDCIWIGDASAGLRCRLRGENYVRPYVNVYYNKFPLNIPDSWSNGGRGGAWLYRADSGDVRFEAYSGPRTLRAGEQLHFDFDLLLTPMRPIDPPKRFAMRYYHNGGPNFDKFIDGAVEGGANVLNVHHGNDLNPCINYPFLTVDAMRAFVRQGHDRNLKVKIYYTVRELTNWVVELWALRSLGGEVIAAGEGETVLGQGGIDDWLTTHLRSDYIAAWKHVFDSGKFKGQVDASLLTTSLSRWHNYYLEGLDWLLRHVEIDGIYIDDTSYDRTVMKRVRKILDRGRPGSLIDLHSWNHFESRAGWSNCANLYMEIFPYVDSIWFGEGFDYNKPPDYWLVEISGLPYGVMGEMLEGGGNPWRGMLYGMTGRLPWAGNPAGMWKFWDRFGIGEAQMIGYWSPHCPVRTDAPGVLATVYRKPGKALISIASWEKEATECRLDIDWEALGLKPESARLSAPAIDGFQEAATFEPDGAIRVEPGKGFLLLLE